MASPKSIRVFGLKKSGFSDPRKTGGHRAFENKNGSRFIYVDDRHSVDRAGLDFPRRRVHHIIGTAHDRDLGIGVRQQILEAPAKLGARRVKVPLAELGCSPLKTVPTASLRGRGWGAEQVAAASLLSCRAHLQKRETELFSLGTGVWRRP